MFLSRDLFAVRAASTALLRCGLGTSHRTALSFRDGSAVSSTRAGFSLELPGWEGLAGSTLFRREAPEDREARAPAEAHWEKTLKR